MSTSRLAVCRCVSWQLMLIVFFDGQRLGRCDEPLTTVVTSPETRVAIDSLTAQWAIWREQVKALHLEGFRFTGLCSSKEEAIGREEILSMVSDTIVPWLQNKITATELVTSASLAELPLETIFPRLSGGVKEYARAGTGWVEFALLQDPQGRRVDYKSAKEEKVIVRRDGKEQRYSSKTKQADLFPTERGRRVEEIDDFLYMPGLKALNEFEALSPGRCALSRSGSRFVIEFDPGTGFVFHDHRAESADRFVFDRLQALPLNAGNLPPVPRVIAELSYHSPKGKSTFVRRVDCYIITQAHFNPEISNDAFRVKAPSGTVIADHEHLIPSKKTKSGVRPISRRIRESTTDVVAKASEPGFTARVPPTIPHDDAVNKHVKKRSLTLIVINVALLGCVMVWWGVSRRARHTEGKERSDA